MSSTIRGVLVDLSGTLHVGEHPLPGALAALARLRRAALPLRFVTNTSAKSRSALLQQLEALGFDVQPHEVFSSLAAARRLIDEEQLRPFCLLHPDALSDFDGVPTDNLNAVLVGLAQEAFSYAALNQAFRILHGNPDAQLIAVHKGLYFKESDGLSLGPGPFVIALEAATSRAARIVGKPEPSFFALALSDLGLPAESVVMIGDDVQSDVGGAQTAGMRSVLVRTGKYLPGDEADKGVMPDAVVDNFPAAVEWLLHQMYPDCHTAQ